MQTTCLKRLKSSARNKNYNQKKNKAKM